MKQFFLPQKSLFFLKLAKISNFSFLFRILLVQVEENYTKNNDLQYFLFQIKIANEDFDEKYEYNDHDYSDNKRNVYEHAIGNHDFIICV